MPKKQKNGRATQRPRRNNRKTLKNKPLSVSQYEIKVNNINELFDDKLIDAKNNQAQMKNIQFIRNKNLRIASRRRK